MSPAPLRADAARNRQRIVDVARRLVDEGSTVQLNEVARLAGTGVATVYRHFPSPQALVEAVAAPGLVALVAGAERALTLDDAWQAFCTHLLAVADAECSDAAVAAATSTPTCALPQTGEHLQRLSDLTGELLARAQAAGAVSAEMEKCDLMPMMCGVAAAAAASPGDRRATAQRFLSLLLAGMRAQA